MGVGTGSDDGGRGGGGGEDGRWRGARSHRILPDRASAPPCDSFHFRMSHKERHRPCSSPAFLHHRRNRKVSPHCRDASSGVDNPCKTYPRHRRSSENRIVDDAAEGGSVGHGS